jgi:hypothetical protein
MKFNNEAGTTFGATVGILDYLGSKFDQNGKMVEKAGAVQKDQTTATDKLTEQTVKAQKSLEGMSIEINKLGFTLLPQTATAVAATTKAMKDMVAWVNKELGKPTSEDDEQALSGKKGALAGAASMGAAGAVLGSVIPGIGTVIGGAIGAAIGGVAGGAGLIDYGIKGKDGLLEKSGMKENAAIISGAAPTPTAGSAGLGGDVDKILETIKKRESGGNYAAQAKGSSASGAYQFIDSTWQAQSKKAGVGMEFKSAKDAPKEIQDAVAKSMVQDILKQAGGDVSKVPLAWYTGNVQGKISDKALAANNGLTPEMYQSKWMKDYSKTTGVEVPTMASRTTPAGPAAGPAPLAGPATPYQGLTPEAARQQAMYTPPPAAAAPVPASTDQPVQIMVAQLDQLQQLVASMKTQVAVSEKLLRMQS